MKLFTDGSDLVGVETPLDIPYIKLLRLHMMALVSWPHEELGEKKVRGLLFWRIYTLGLEIACVITNSMFLKINHNIISFFEMGHTYITALMNAVAASRAMLPFLEGYHSLVKDFLLSIHLFNHKHKSKYAMEIHIFIHKLSHFFVVYIVCMMFFGITLFNVIPLYNSYISGAFNAENGKNVTYELSGYHAFPFDYIHDFRGYCVVFIFNWYQNYIVSALFCMVDVFLCVMVFHVWGHMKLLINNLEAIPEPGHVNEVNNSESVDEIIASGSGIDYCDDAGSIILDSTMYTYQEMVEVCRMLRDNILHHIYICQFSGRMSTIYGPIILVYHTFHLVSGCLLLLECSQLDPKALARYGPLTFIIFQQLIQISLVFELLGSMSDKINQALYFVPWQCMDVPARRVFIIFLRQSQASTSLKAGDMVEVGVRTMTSSDKINQALYFVPWQCMDVPARRVFIIFLRQSQASTSLKAGDMVEVGVRTMTSILKASISYFTLLLTRTN